eukprot:GFUD01095431.1.p1 GENE.GFUD01095431.1~~GFUD01095431.1.p1  ORF type:complete len:324 (+),score=72.05 GFUD01095431.1:151-1122(+)
MTSYFADIPSFISWLETKTEAELKSKLFRADPSARLNGSKPVLVRRLVEATRHLGQEREGCIFPELRRRRQQDHLARIDITRQRVRTAQRNFMAQASQVAGREAPAREQHRRPAGQEARPVRSLAGNASTTTRPVPIFPVPILHTLTPVEPSIPPPVTQHFQQEARVLTPLGTGFRNPRNIFAESPGNLFAARTPEQVLREALEVQAGLIIQSISQAATPRLRHNSMLRMGAGADSPKPSRLRAASTSSAEKRGPEVTLEEDKYQVKLECKICFDGSVNTVLLPCGHACCCQDCSVKLKFATWDSKCPICRNRIHNISMLYFS